MVVVTLEVATREQANERFLRALEGEILGDFISFKSPEVLFKFISGKRWELLKAMTGVGAMTIREAARRTGRGVKEVHRDVQALLKAGILRKTQDRLIVFPFDAVHVDFMLKAE